MIAMTPEIRAGIIDYANRSFRDVADRDYIAARTCHRLGLEQQFLWMALQALEKYLKAILLFNFRSTKGYGHRVKDAFDALSLIKDISFDIPPDVGPFLHYIEDQGANRYFTQPFFTMGEELLMLDKSVWHLRLYCQFIRQGTFQSGGKTVDWFLLNLAKIHHERHSKRPNSVRVFGGFLEKIIDGRDSPLRRELVWKNFYYGRRPKKVVKNIVLRSSSGNPTHFMHPAVFEELDKLVKFEPEVKAHFKKL